MTTPTLELRILSPDEVDLTATVDVLNAAFRRYPFLTEDRTSLRDIVDELAPSSRLLQVFEENELVGTATVTPAAAGHVDVEKFPGIDLSGSLYFAMAGVRPDRMGMGIGRQLVAEAERLAREEGFERILLSTIEEMGNVAYYAGFGYRSVSVREHPIGYWGLTIPTREHGMSREMRPFVREVRPAEAAAVAALVNRAYEVEDFFKVGDRTDAEEVARIIERDRFFAVEDAGELVGCAYLGITDGRGHFGMLSVDPERQGAGVARRLIEHMEAFCLERGCGWLDLEYVNLREELPAFYERFGFEVTGEEPWPTDALDRISRPAHFVTMSKRLGGR